MSSSVHDPDDPGPSCPFWMCGETGDQWFDALWQHGALGQPARFRVCSRHLNRLNAWFGDFVPTHVPAEFHGPTVGTKSRIIPDPFTAIPEVLGGRRDLDPDDGWFLTDPNGRVIASWAGWDLPRDLRDKTSVNAMWRYELHAPDGAIVGLAESGEPLDLEVRRLMTNAKGRQTK